MQRNDDLRLSVWDVPLRVDAIRVDERPSTFQRMMYHLFQGLRFVSVYLDDVAVSSRSVEKHTSHLREVLKVSATSLPKLKISKCSFTQCQTRFIGHIISRKSVHVDPEKINFIRGELEPSNKA